MPEWVTLGHALYLGVLSGLASLGFLPLVRTVAWNVVLKRLHVPLDQRQQLALDAARHHLGIAEPPLDPPELDGVSEYWFWPHA